MKRIFCLILSLLMICGIFCGCSQKKPDDDNQSSDDEQKEDEITFDPGEPDYSFETVDASEELYGSDYREKYLNQYFFNDRNDDVVYTVNYMTDIFGLRNPVTNPDYGIVTNGQRTVYAISNTFGNEPTWFEWNIKKIMWMGLSAGKDAQALAKQKIADFAQNENGYIWSWGDRAYWQVDAVGGRADYDSAAVAYHYDGTFRFIAAVADVVNWENSTDFLDVVDNTADGTSPVDMCVDVSAGRTVWQKTEKAFQFILENLNGKNGIIILPNSAPEGLSERAQRLYNTSGNLGANSANYWDNYAYGGYDAYENALFYNVLIKMAGLYARLDREDDREYCLELAQTVKENYDTYFWNETTGRYLNAIETQSGKQKKFDYGLTFQNTEALVYGLGDTDKAESIYSWIDGTRIVESDIGETGLGSVGEDIYAYSIAPRTNTVAIESVFEDGKSWWHAPETISVTGNAAWDRHQTNGGIIFFTEFYDLLARAKYQGADSVYERYKAIADFYRDTKFSEQNSSVRNSWKIGVLYEFPESGLVPSAYLYGILGIDADEQGLKIEPQLPSAYNFAGVSAMFYGGNDYKVTINKNGILEIETLKDGNYNSILNFPSLRYKDSLSYTNYKYEVFNAEGKLTFSGKAEKDEEGYVVLEVLPSSKIGVGKLVVTPQS